MNERLLLGSGHGVGAAGWREKTQGSRVGTGEVQGGVAPRQGGWRGLPVVVSEPLQLRSQLAGCVHLPLAHLPEQPRRQRVLLAARHHLRHRLPIVSQALVLAAFVIVRVVNVNGLLLGVAADDATHVVAMRLREPDAHPAMNEAGGGGRGGLWGVLRASRCAWATSGWRLHGAPPPGTKSRPRSRDPFYTLGHTGKLLLTTLSTLGGAIHTYCEARALVRTRQGVSGSLTQPRRSSSNSHESTL